MAPHPDYAAAELLFGDVVADACTESFSFGKDGRPLLICGPLDTRARIRERIKALQRKLGESGFDFVADADIEDDDIFEDEDTDIEDMGIEDEADEAIEYVAGMRYDPAVAPDPAKWLELDEMDRVLLAEGHHRRAEIDLPDTRVHAVIHVIIENQVAMGDELPVRRAIERLMGEGLDRHEAVHAVGSVLAGHLTDILKPGAPHPGNHEAYNQAVERLTAESWRAEFGPDAEDERP